MTSRKRKRNSGNPAKAAAAMAKRMIRDFTSPQRLAPGSQGLVEYLFVPSPEDPKIGVLHLVDGNGEKSMTLCDPAWLQMLLSTGQRTDIGTSFADMSIQEFVEAGRQTRRILPAGRRGWVDDSDDNLAATAAAAAFVEENGWDALLREFF